MSQAVFKHSLQPVPWTQLKIFVLACNRTSLSPSWQALLFAEAFAQVAQYRMDIRRVQVRIATFYRHGLCGY
jgi:hypothetical protein